MNKKFIVTTDKDTAVLMKNEGFICVEESTNKWVFINTAASLNFDNKEVYYTNNINI